MLPKDHKHCRGRQHNVRARRWVDTGEHIINTICYY